MPKVSNKDIYAQDPSLDMEDYLLGTNYNSTNKKTQTYSLSSIFSLFYNFLGYNDFLFTTDTDTYPIASPGCFFAFDEHHEITSDFQQARKLTFSSNDTYNFNVTEYLQMLVDSDKFLFKLINLEDKNNFIFLKPRNFTLSNTLTSFDVNIEIQYGLSNGNFVNYKKYLLLLEFDANTFDPADYDLTDFTNTSGNPFVTSQDLTNALSLLPSIITNHSGLNLDDGTNPHGTTKSDVGLSNVDNTSDIDKPISIATQQALDLKANASDLGDVAVSNDYNDLDNLPTIPNNLEELHNVTETNYTTPIDADSVLTFDVTNSLWKRLSWANIKSNLKTYFDTLYLSLSIFNEFETAVFDSLDNKLDKSTTPSSVYGTNASGGQTMIPVSEFIYTTDGKSYESLSSAMAVIPLPENNTIFYIDESNLTERGVYAYDSSEVSGYRFVRDYTPNGVVEEGNTKAVSGGEVFRYNEKLLNKTGDLYESFNAFNKSTIIDGFYIVNTTGFLDPYAQASVSDWIDVKGWTVGYLSGKNSGTVNSVRFKDENGNILKPVDSTGNPLASFNIGFANGLVYIPTTAVAFQFTVKFQTFNNISRVQFEKGNIQTNYKDFGIGTLKKSLLNSGLRIDILPDNVNVRSNFNNNTDVYMTLNKSISNNKLFNIYTAKIIGRNDLDTATGLALNGAGDDDAAPARLNDTYIGANHGALGALVVNVSSHNKTLADIGSRWVDDEGQVFVLLRILSPTQLFVISTNRGVDTWNFKGGIAGDLTYVSNGTNTSVITPINTILSQLYPSVKNIKHTYILDGEIKTEGTHNGKKLVVAEFYDIVDVPTMLDNLTNNRPVGGYTVQPTLTDGDTLATINNNYIVTKGCNVVLEWNISIKKQCKFERYGAVQAEYIKPSWVTNYNRFYPNSLPINGYDFRLPTNIEGAYTAEMNLTSEYWEDSNFPVIRSVDRLNGSNNIAINFNIGYLPIMSQINRKDQINNAWWMWTSKKQYPNAIDNKIGSILAVGETRSGVAFRGWSDATTDFYNKHKVVYEEDIYYFLDVFSVGIFRFSDNELIGKKIEVVYKTQNINLLTELSSGYIDIQSLVKSPQYGNIILKIS